jgi:hypothetical protein
MMLEGVKGRTHVVYANAPDLYTPLPPDQTEDVVFSLTHLTPEGSRSSPVVELTSFIEHPILQGTGGVASYGGRWEAPG